MNEPVQREPTVVGANESWRLDGRVALVTGASAGLGARFVRVLHEAGAHIIATARRADCLDELRGDLGVRIETIAGDIANPTTGSPSSKLVRRHGHLDVLVNNAGICDEGPLDDQSLEDLLRVVEVNLVSVLDLCRLSAGLLRAAPAASVINVASIYGVVGSRGPMAAYNATKGALVNLTRHLAAVWGESGVRVNALAPGYFPTPMTGFLTEPAFAQFIRERTLLGRTPYVGRTRRAAAFSRHCLLELHDWTDASHRRWVDRGVSKFTNGPAGNFEPETLCRRSITAHRQLPDEEKWARISRCPHQ